MRTERNTSFGFVLFDFGFLTPSREIKYSFGFGLCKCWINKNLHALLGFERTYYYPSIAKPQGEIQQYLSVFFLRASEWELLFSKILNFARKWRKND